MQIVSGGQTGVDRAALDVALELGIPCGGWCPAGRWAEDGEIPAQYPLRESRSTNPAERTRRNVHDSDATLVLLRGLAEGGTALTIRLANECHRPLLVLDLAESPDPDSLRSWVESHGVSVLNVAGPRESTRPGIYCEAAAFLREALAR